MTKLTKTKLINTTASILTATTLLVSGGYTYIISLFGGTTNITPKKDYLNNSKKKTTKFIHATDVDHTILRLTIDNKKIDINESTLYSEMPYQYNFKNNSVIIPAERYENYDCEANKEINFLYKLETTEAITQQENINRLVRKKETIDKNKNANKKN